MSLYQFLSLLMQFVSLVLASVQIIVGFRKSRNAITRLSRKD